MVHLIQKTNEQKYLKTSLAMLSPKERRLAQLGGTLPCSSLGGLSIVWTGRNAQECWTVHTFKPQQPTMLSPPPSPEFHNSPY